MKIAVVGAGNAGCFTALHYAFHLRKADFDIELIYNPDILPERVGQATLLQPPTLLYHALDFNWHNNPIHATFKSGILYEGWGKKNDEVFQPFGANTMAMHYCPWEMQDYILNSGWFKVTEGDVDPQDVDADYVFDCRGKPTDLSDYDELKNPTNACILGKPQWDTSKTFWSRHVATPDGWTFVIPTSSESPSHDYCVGYCYNSDITSREDAEKNFLDMFEVEIVKHINYKNYVVKNPIIDDRILLNGNRLFFLDPLESSSTETYLRWARLGFDFISGGQTLSYTSQSIKDYISKVQNFVLWHYQFGSKYNTPFWDYAKTLTFNDPDFNLLLKKAKRSFKWQINNNMDDVYSQWPLSSFKVWYDGMSRSYD